MSQKHREPNFRDFLIEICGNDLSQTEERSWWTAKTLSCLPERNHRMIRLRYGIGTGISWTLAEIGLDFGISETRVRQLLFKSICKIQEFVGTPISDLDVRFLSCQVWKSKQLKKAGIYKIGDLTSKTESELLNDDFSFYRIQEIKTWLVANGLSLKGDKR